MDRLEADQRIERDRRLSGLEPHKGVPAWTTGPELRLGRFVGGVAIQSGDLFVGAAVTSGSLDP